MLKEQPSPFWNAETFFSQIITSTIPYFFVFKINWPYQIRRKKVKKVKFTFWAQIQKQKTNKNGGKPLF